MVTVARALGIRDRCRSGFSREGRVIRRIPVNFLSRLKPLLPEDQPIADDRWHQTLSSISLFRAHSRPL